jgi:hypothetical protein
MGQWVHTYKAAFYGLEKDEGIAPDRAAELLHITLDIESSRVYKYCRRYFNKSSHLRTYTKKNLKIYSEDVRL